MTDTAELELMSPREAYELASQWGSYMRDGDPGAVFYSFSALDATPQGSEHRAQLLTYTKPTAGPSANRRRRPRRPRKAESFSALPGLGRGIPRDLSRGLGQAAGDVR
jgi:hypothetical protein